MTCAAFDCDDPRPVTEANGVDLDGALAHQWCVETDDER